MSNEFVGWFLLGVAVFIFLAARVRPAGRHGQRAFYALASGQGLLAVERLTNLPRWMDVPMLIAGMILLVVSIASFVLAFRSGEISFTRNSS
jgi:hypothetical protein